MSANGYNSATRRQKKYRKM